ncbi:MAG: hypothetical protein HXN95_11370 [Prevotella salivae]|jgi:hypothetical protein|uniref:hypothetical protein n=1 Tax=Segatella salivae TaxID=228604 RepID=UPI001CAC365D|nr:hypothetical protein [Segatella salivae]MBF1522596.1 hypothetical protein [Segatella salivae]
MKIKSATLLGMIGAIISIALYVFFFLLNIKAIKLVQGMDYVYTAVNVVSNLCQLFSAFTLAIFFYVLHKNQK